MKIGIYQFAPSVHREENYNKVSDAVAYLADKGAKIIVIPEIWICEFNNSTIPNYAEEIPGPSTLFLAELAKNHGVYIIGGTIPHKNDDKIFNTCPVLNPSGKLIGKYSKKHPFKLNIPNSLTINEGDIFSKGNELFSFAVDDYKIGVAICFDLRFPDIALDYALKENCNVLIYPSAFTNVTGPKHWELLGRARAIDSQCWVILVSSSYDENAFFKGYGHSMVVDPSGIVQKQLSGSEEQEIFTIDIEAVRTARNMLPVLQSYD